ncbi:MAG: rane protein [Verrucomicrobiales bacterium]|jgi:uncharacterized YccA/Bax inhibitor family protein|nr:rane protein [Verrucomicrobiales bacterium]
MRSSNPALRDDTFVGYGGDATMTLAGTINKTGILLLLAMGSGALSWSLQRGGAGFLLPGIGLIGGFIVAMVTIFKPSISPYTAPVYAVLEGFLLGAIASASTAKSPGIASQAMILTFGTLFGMLAAYKFGVIKPTESFKRGVIAATLGIAVFYAIALVVGMFGVNIPLLHDSSMLGIVISLGIVVVAALNLVLDFDFIEQGVNNEAPKYMEWYGAFSIMVTLVWLYLEILRLLRRLRN